MRTITLTLAVSAAMFLLAACGGVAASPNPSDPTSSQPPASVNPGSSPAAAGPEGPWQLAAGTVDGAPLVLGADSRVTFIVDGSSVGGQSACNQYFGEFGLVDGRVSLTNLGGTEMACDEPTMTLEAAYLQGLAAVQSATVDGDSLVLQGPGVELRFERLQPPPTAEIVETDWVLESVLSGDAASSTVGDPATLVLDADGTLSGSTGCRTFEGTYTLEGDEVAFTDWGLEGECEGPAAEQDSTVVTVLGDGFRAAVDAQQLTLTDEGGLGLVYRANAGS